MINNFNDDDDDDDDDDNKKQPCFTKTDSVPGNVITFKYVFMNLQNCPVRDHIYLTNVQISAEAEFYSC